MYIQDGDGFILESNVLISLAELNHRKQEAYCYDALGTMIPDFDENKFFKAYGTHDVCQSCRKIFDKSLLSTAQLCLECCAGEDVIPEFDKKLAERYSVKNTPKILTENGVYKHLTGKAQGGL